MTSLFRESMIRRSPAAIVPVHVIVLPWIVIATEVTLDAAEKAKYIVGFEASFPVFVIDSRNGDELTPVYIRLSGAESLQNGSFALNSNSNGIQEM